jgi:outer membrane biosynthesis protein TonB
MIHRKTGNNALARKALSALGQGTQVDERRAIEAAWLDLEEGKEEEAEKAFRKLSSTAFDKVEALSGLGAATAKTAFRTKDRSRLAAAAATLRSALSTPSPATVRIFFQLGNLYFRSGDAVQAEACYRRSAALAPSVQALANLALTLIKTGKVAEAAAITAQVALTDIESARRLAAAFPKDSLTSLFQPQETRTAPRPAPAPPLQTEPSFVMPQEPAIQPVQEPSPQPEPPPEPKPVPQPVFQPIPQPAPQPAAQSQGLERSAGSFKFINPSAIPAPEITSLSPARPQAATISGRLREAASPAPAPRIQIETIRDTMSSISAPTEAESRKDDFISRAFKLASSLEEELGRKVYFNLDGLSEVERKLRLRFINASANPQTNLEMVLNCSAFLCYFLQERHKGRLIKMADFDAWGWPMVFEEAGVKVTTYPVQRAWRLLWDTNVPEPGWLTKYFHWLADSIKETSRPVCGAAAARAKVMSHPERIIDAQTEHRRMLVLISSLSETSHIELGRSGLLKIEAAIKNNFKPGIPPTTDGWKLLRCYGHLLAAILAKDFKAVWYNVDGEDGGWSMQLPSKTLVFPLGKIYKTASLRDDLDEYYEILLRGRLKI